MAVSTLWAERRGDVGEESACARRRGRSSADRVEPELRLGAGTKARPIAPPLAPPIVPWRLRSARHLEREGRPALPPATPPWT